LSVELRKSLFETGKDAMRMTSQIAALVALLASSGSVQANETPTAEALTGRWGLASYFKEADAARIEASARGQCGQPYSITKGPGGGVMMHLPDNPKTSELVIKTSFSKNYIGPEGSAGGDKDREILRYDGRMMVLRWLDASVAGRYGTMVFVRCNR
jgi:hypothetical protein